MPLYSSTSSTTTAGDTWGQWMYTASTSNTTTASTNAVWNIWTGGSDTITTSTAGTDAVFRNWVTTDSTSTNATTITWGNWVQEADRRQRHAMRVARQYTRPAPRITEEERAARAARQERYRQEQEEKRRLRAIADERAMKLLRSMLSEQQNRDLRDHGHFFVDAPSGRRYRIDKGRSGNVKVIDKQTGTWVESLCIHQKENVPLGDTMLMQKLLIETAEETFRKHANITKKHGAFEGSKGGLLTADKLGNVIPFRRERQAAA